MTTEFGSFDASRLGAFKASQFGDARNAGQSTEVLLWAGRGYETSGLFAFVEQAISRTGHGYKTIWNWSGRILDYRAVIFLVPNYTPEWWGPFLEPSWHGLMYLVGGFSSADLGVQKFINDPGQPHGMRIGNEDLDQERAYNGAAFNDEITQGAERLLYFSTSLVTGGKPLYGREGSPGNWMARNLASPKVWLLSGNTYPLLAAGGHGYPAEMRHLSNVIEVGMRVP